MVWTLRILLVTRSLETMAVHVMAKWNTHYMYSGTFETSCPVCCGLLCNFESCYDFKYKVLKPGWWHEFVCVVGKTLFINYLKFELNLNRSTCTLYLHLPLVFSIFCHYFCNQFFFSIIFIGSRSDRWNQESSSTENRRLLRAAVSSAGGQAASSGRLAGQRHRSGHWHRPIQPVRQIRTDQLQTRCPSSSKRVSKYLI